METVKFRYKHGWYKVNRKGFKLTFFKEFTTNDPYIIEQLRLLKLEEVPIEEPKPKVKSKRKNKEAN